jgi:hypothetical protein
MCSSNTCDMYMCRLKHINDPVLSSLKIEGVRFFMYALHKICLLHALANLFQDKNSKINQVII